MNSDHITLLEVIKLMTLSFTRIQLIFALRISFINIEYVQIQLEFHGKLILNIQLSNSLVILLITLLNCADVFSK